MSESKALLPENIASSIREIREDVRRFVTDRYSYYGVTRTGMVFDIVRCHTMQPPIEDSEDYHTYMLVFCLKGTYVLRQRFIGGCGQDWYLELEVALSDPSIAGYYNLKDYIDEDPSLLNKLCGPPHAIDFDPIKMERHLYIGSTYVATVDGEGNVTTQGFSQNQ